MTQQSSSFRRIYGTAIILAAVTVAGLLSALFGDGIWNELSWVALSIPLIVILWKYYGPKKRHGV
jgi:membrane protein implicated in regulation of membrane protease activity